MGVVQLLGLAVIVHGLPAAVQKGNAPPTAMQTASESASFAARDLPGDLGDVPMVIVGEDDACKAVEGGGLTDEWCTSTCKDNKAGCPDMCECSDDNMEVVTEDPLEAAQKEAEKAAKDAANGIVPPVEGAAPVEVVKCYADANKGSNQCGPISKATCTGNGEGEAKGKCCSVGGYCGNGPEYCTDDMQKDYSHGHNVCAAAGTAAAAAGTAADAAADGAAEKPAECLKDGNLVSSMCGPALQMTCTGSHGLGQCCSATGWCGEDPEFCGEGMQKEYSNGKNLCKDELPEGVDSIDDVESMCMTLDQVAVSWVSAA